MLPPHLVEHRPVVVAVAKLAETPDEIRHGVRGPDGVAESNPAPAAHAVHDEPVAAIAEDEPLVAEKREVRLRPRRARHDRAHPRQLVAAEADGLRRRRPQQARNSEQQRHAEGADRRAQEARRVARERESPPQVVGVLDVLVGEETEPHRREQDERGRHDPRRAHPLRGQRRLTVEVPPARQQRREHQSQRERLLVVEALEQRDDHADREQRDGQQVCPVETLLDAVGEEQERRACHAADEVRELEHRQRDQTSHRRQPPPRRRRRPRKQQDRAAQKTGDREDLRHNARRPPPEQTRRSPHAFAPSDRLVGRQQHSGRRERGEIVDDPEREQGPERRDGGYRRGKQEDHHPFEDAEPAGHLARHRGHWASR